MESNKQTKRALQASVLSLILCLAMLIATTFAWFTDSVTNSNNKIVAGNLDIKVSYKNAHMAGEGENFAEFNETTDNLFVNSTGGKILWEPGAATVAYLKVENAGSLALKYKLSVDAEDIVTGTDGAALSDVLKTAVVEIKESDVGTYNRATAIEAAKAANASSILDYSKEGTMNGKGANPAPVYLAMIIYFPEEIGNTVNGKVYNTGEVALETDLTLKITATQLAQESDSFGPDYDNGAWNDIAKQDRLEDLIEGGYKDVSSNQALTNATETEEKIVVSEDLVVDQNTPTVKGSTTIDFNHGKVTRATRDGSGLKVSNYDADVTLQNAEFISTKGGTTVRVEGAKSLTIKNSNFICEAPGSTGNEIFQLTPSEAGKKMTVTFENCVFDTGYVGVDGYNNITDYDIRFVNCKFIWNDINGSSFVQAGAYAKGTYSFDECYFEYNDWWSGDLIEVDNYKEKSTVNLNNIKVKGSGAKNPYVVSGFSYGGKQNLTVTYGGVNQYIYNDYIVEWDTIAVNK